MKTDARCVTCPIVFETELGFMAVALTDKGVSRVVLPERTREEALARLGETGPLGTNPRLAGQVVGLLRDWAKGKDVDLSKIPLDLSQGSDFERSVWEAARFIRRGETVSYGELATRLGKSGAARAVGSALGKNPVPVLVPCHRILAASGAIGGFSAPGGLELKRLMLELEGRRLV